MQSSVTDIVDFTSRIAIHDSPTGHFAMSITCIIPAKSYVLSKSRLAVCLSHQQRIDLSRWLLQRTLRLVRPLFFQVIVVSSDQKLLREIQDQNVCALAEDTPGLNPALTQAAEVASSRGASGIFVLPADLPRLGAGDVEAILRLGAASPAVVIAPCRHGTGTNALLLRPPHAIPFAFGLHSFSAHSNLARIADIQPIVYRAPNVALDLDTPADWELIYSQIPI
jgi:2-phospho-L-lactate guanylyltransferase